MVGDMLMLKLLDRMFKWKPDLMDAVNPLLMSSEVIGVREKAVESRLVIGCGHLWRDPHK